MPHSDRLSRALMIVAVGCAVIVTGKTVLGSTGPRGEPGRGPAARPEPIAISDWQDFARTGHAMGPADAPVTIVEFADFECPVCRAFTTGALAAIRAAYPQDVRVVFRHWPLKYHRFAYPAARAAECAGDQGRFEAFHDLLYQKQDSLGLKSFAEFAKEAGVANLSDFGDCQTRTTSVPAIEADVGAALALGGKGTPTILINETLLPGAPSRSVLDSLIRASLAARR